MSRSSLGALVGIAASAAVIVGCGETLAIVDPDARTDATTKTKPANDGAEAGRDGSGDDAITPSDSITVPSATHFVFLGACSWSLGVYPTCSYDDGHAIATFYQRESDKHVFVVNTIATEDGSLCEAPLEAPSESSLRAVDVEGNKLTWEDENGKNSMVTVQWSDVLELQTTESAANSLESLDFLRRNAACWFQRSIDATEDDSVDQDSDEDEDEDEDREQ